MEIIAIEKAAFYLLLDKAVEHLKENKQQEAWLTPEETMKRLNIKSKTTLAGYRTRGLIKFTQPTKGKIQYCKASIDEFLEKHSRLPFN